MNRDSKIKITNTPNGAYFIGILADKGSTDWKCYRASITLEEALTIATRMVRNYGCELIVKKVSKK